MESLDRTSDQDDAFSRLREVLGAPDRRGWRRHLRRRPKGLRFVEHGASADADLGARSTRPRLAVLAALPLLGAAAVLLVSIARPSAPIPSSIAKAASSDDDDAAAAVDVASPDPAPLPQQVWPGEEVTMSGNGEVGVGRQRWSVGTDGDVVVIGDWNCDRQPTPAVLRPSTGGFYVFDRWAAPGQPAAARKVTDVPRAVTATAAGCGAVVLRTDDGAERRVATEVVQ